MPHDSKSPTDPPGADPKAPAPAETDGWAEHELAQRDARLRLTYAERLRWLEQAKRFVEQARRAKRT